MPSGRHWPSIRVMWGRRVPSSISDDELVESLERNQLRLQRERGIDVTVFSPRASWMGHHIGNEHTSRHWSEHCNDLIRRVCDLYPANFAPVCQLPQSPGVGIEPSVRELRRCVDEMGFVGCNLNPDPSGGTWDGPPLVRPVLVAAVRRAVRARRTGDGARRARPAIRTSTRRARTTSRLTRPRSCRRSRPGSSATIRKCAG